MQSMLADSAARRSQVWMLAAVGMLLVGRPSADHHQAAPCAEVAPARRAVAMLSRAFDLRCVSGQERSLTDTRSAWASFGWNIEITIGDDGRASRAAMSPEAAATPLGRCLHDVVMEARFPSTTKLAVRLGVTEDPRTGWIRNAFVHSDELDARYECE